MQGNAVVRKVHAPSSTAKVVPAKDTQQLPMKPPGPVLSGPSSDVVPGSIVVPEGNNAPEGGVIT